MSAPKKPQGGSDSELTKLKNLSPERREVIWGWRSETDDGKPLTNAVLRNRLASQFGIRLSRDGQLSEFWSWQWHQMRVEGYNAKLEQFQDFYAKQNPNASRQQVRDAGIAFFMTEAAANGDRDGFLDVANLDLNERDGRTKAKFKQEELDFKREKFQFDAAKAALKCVAELKAISSNKNLSEAEKVDQARLKLFGVEER